MVHNIIIIAGFWILYATLLSAIYYLKEKLMWQPKPYGILDFYPWICRKCLTTWTIIASYICIGIIISNFWFALAGVLLGIGTGYGMYYTEKERGM